MTAIDLLLEAVGDEWWRSLCCECGYPTAAEEGPVVSVVTLQRLRDPLDVWFALNQALLFQ